MVVGTYCTVLYLNYRAQERKLLQVLLKQLLTAISSIPQQRGPAEPVPDTTPVSVTVEHVKALCSRANCGQEYMTAECWQSVEQNLSSAVTCLQRYDHSISEGKWEELDMLTTLGKAKVCVGVAQAHLLCPSPIDPIVTARTRQQCLQLMVRTSEGLFRSNMCLTVSNVLLQIERNSHQIEAWNAHFLVMVGREFGELFQEDRLPPVLRDLIRKSQDLAGELESAPSLPSAREGTSEVSGVSSVGHGCVVLGVVRRLKK